MRKLHANMATLDTPTCSTCSERFPGLHFHSKSNECLHCSRDKHIPKLYSSANNMNPDPIPPQLHISNTDTYMHSHWCLNPLNATATLMSALISKCHTAELPLTRGFVCTSFICAFWVYIAHVDSIFLKKVHFERGIAIKTCDVITFNTYTRLPWTHIFCPSIHSYLSFPYPRETGSNDAERTP